MAYQLLRADFDNPSNESKRDKIGSKMERTDPTQSDWGTRLIRKKFTDMRAEDSRFIRPDMLFDEGPKRGELTHGRLKELIKKQFRLEK
jgi:hypothetical protein